MGAELSGLQPEPAATPSILALSSAAPSAAAVESTEVESSRPSPAPPDSVEQRLQSEKADETIFHPAVPLGLCTSAAVARHIVAIIGTQWALAAVTFMLLPALFLPSYAGYLSAITDTTSLRW